MNKITSSSVRASGMVWVRVILGLCILAVNVILNEEIYTVSEVTDNEITPRTELFLN